MKVWIAEIVYYYEGSVVVGVFDSEEKAREHGEKRRIGVLHNSDGTTYTYNKGDALEVTEWEIA